VGKTVAVALQGAGQADELKTSINETLSVSGSLLTKLFTAEEKVSRSPKVNEEVSTWATRGQRSARGSR
jgi:hypothetical protein